MEHYYRIQSALMPHMVSSTELMSAMSSIWPLIEPLAEDSKILAEMRAGRTSELSPLGDRRRAALGE
jgi:hypothetical protein